MVQKISELPDGNGLFFARFNGRWEIVNYIDGGWNIHLGVDANGKDKWILFDPPEEWMTLDQALPFLPTAKGG